MKITYRFKAVLTLIFLMGFVFLIQAQKKYEFKHHTILIKGTSNIHDWEMDVEDVNGFIEIKTENNEISISNISLIIPVKSMKSGKGKMDNNTYEALKEKKNPNITFSFFKTTSIQAIDASTYKAIVKGSLNIAGKTQDISIPLVINTTKKQLTTNYTLKMTDYGVEPPKAVFGTIKTGDAVQLNFDLNY